MSYPTSTKVSIAARRPAAMNLSCSHYTTLNYGHLVPVYCSELVPGDKFHINASYFARTAPMALPTYTPTFLNLRAFFVPYRSVWNLFDNFITRSPAVINAEKKFVKTVPFIYPYYLLKLLLDHYTDNAWFADDETADGFDFVTNMHHPSQSVWNTAKQHWISSPSSHILDDDELDLQIKLSQRELFANNRLKIQLNRQGKLLLQIFHSLGYNFDTCLSENSFDGYWNHGITLDSLEEPLSALPLLAFCKCWIDWYVPQRQRMSRKSYDILTQLASGHYEGAVITEQLYSLFTDFVLYYKNDYFTSAWLEPNNPGGIVESGSVLTPIDLNRYNSNERPYHFEIGEGSSSGTVQGFVKSDANGVHTDPVSFESLQIVNRFANYIRRNNFSGFRPIERLFARFGVKNTAEQLKLSQFLTYQQKPLQVSDITSTGSVQDLGAYGGRGIFASQKPLNVNYKADEYGMIFILASIMPDNSIIDGTRRYLHHTMPFDFYTPEFDGTLFQAIGKDEFMGRINGVPTEAFDKPLSQSIFGYIPRYAEYKCSFDNVSGDFNVERYRRPILNFINPRHTFSAVTSDGSVNLWLRPNELNPVSIHAMHDQNQYDRIFRETTGYVDPFFFVFNFDVKAFRPMIPADEAVDIAGSGREYSTETNGTVMN